MSKVDKIVASFRKTIDKLHSESARLDTIADRERAASRKAAIDAENADFEAARADKIAKNLEGLINE